ncbi:MAG: response regulator transcription factor [Defluviitaleaceae bacterium]|nr:response regulator transcription factor [Defluviitaleaceae bacterium]
MSKILVVDDEKSIVKGIKFSLEQDKMDVDVAYDGEEAINLATENDYHLIILDIMLPKIDGLEVCQNIREFSNVPIIMLTAKGEPMDKVMGLDFGADDYITKPFNIVELKSRIKAILRRTTIKESKIEDINTITFRDLKIDIKKRQVYVKNEEINLTIKEFDILELFMTNEGKIYSRDDLLKIVWGDNYIGDIRTVDVHVRRLREKLEEIPSNPRYIFTKWGIGYYFC